MTVTTTIEPSQGGKTRVRLVSFDLTRKCQLACTHCYNESGPGGTHGTMARDDWFRALDQAAEYGVSTVQFIGGEPTMHPDLHHLVDNALSLGMQVEVFSNLVRVTDADWALFALPGVSLATSYYSDRAEVHNALTGRASHHKTRANIERAVSRGLPLRVGIIVGEGDDGAAARADLESLGVTRVGIDHVRGFGRGQGEHPACDVTALCGRCGHDRAAIGPDGEVSPCTMSGWLKAGNVRMSPLADILSGEEMAGLTATIPMLADPCSPNDTSCAPDAYPCYPSNE
ncbi:radical SAM protein [Streptacidiphilus sp. P02-A3a]|uniref:radical SAM protein n=1 Tax=Streptacidiphilus sp. P02-A3a TaxID=2704468 RepID=UPI001CDCA5E2|nr:radical SAM protein [Streptacidiphilus sp. P02-A3a]